MTNSLAELVDAAVAQITRFAPRDALAAVTGERGQIIDIRSADARGRDGVVPGSLHIPRTVLEWRVAIDSPWRNPHVGAVTTQLILLCDHGYSSILAAATLVQLGFSSAGDVVGGFEAWSRVGLPVTSSRPAAPGPGELPGMGGPDAAPLA